MMLQGYYAILGHPSAPSMTPAEFYAMRTFTPVVKPLSAAVMLALMNWGRVS